MADRFTRAVDQLGSDKLEQRLGGVYGLERIARESPDGDTRLVVVEVLTAYVRQHAHGTPNAIGDLSFVTDLAVRAPDVQAALTVLGRRTALATDPPLDLRGLDLRRANLRGAYLQRADLSDTQLQYARLDDAELQGAKFNRTQLYQAVLERALLQGASFARAQLQQAILTSAQLEGALDFPPLAGHRGYAARVDGSGWS